MKTFQYRKNVYTCEKCDARKVTVDRDYGVTPFMIRCDLCSSRMKSSMYRCDQAMAPTHEWYRPPADEIEQLGPETKEHVRKGGLLLRVIPEPPPVPLWADPIDKLMAETRARFAAAETQHEVDKIMAGGTDVPPVMFKGKPDLPAEWQKPAPVVLTAEQAKALGLKIMEDRFKPPVFTASLRDVERQRNASKPVEAGDGRSGVLCSEDGCNRTEDCGPFCRNKNRR